MKPIDAVREFHEKFDQPVRVTPCVDDEGTNQLRLNLLLEELRELGEALGYKLVHDAHEDRIFFASTGRLDMMRGLDLDKAVATLDALTDLQYVLDGSYVSLGLAAWKDAAFEEVHRSNMSKVWADGSVRKHPDGKVMKPDTYSSADLRGVLLRPDPKRCSCGCAIIDCEYCASECATF